MDDWQLIQEYAARGSERAFRTLVERYLGLVYTSAQRQLNDSQLAEEVAQAVFILLARKAAGLSQATVLPGWLFRTTRFVASRAIRSEQRRRKREQEAYEMQQLQSAETATTRLSPMLDEALSCLRERDRDAVLLRFSHDRNLREVGQQLGISEEAAKKRISRALQRMRSFFTSRGFSVSTLVLAGVCSQAFSAPAPANLASDLASSSLAAAASASASTLSLVRETLNAWRWAKIKLLAVFSASVCGFIFLATVTARHASPFIQSPPNPDSTQRPPTLEPSTSPVPVARKPGVAAASSKERNVQFKVVSKDSGSPIPGAQIGINVVAGGEWKARFDQVTDENGIANVAYPAGAGRLDIGAIVSGWEARCVTWRTDSDPEFPAEYTLRLAPVTNWMGGWLRDEQGKPISSALIEIEFSITDYAQFENPHERPGFVCAAPVARSNPEGYWTCAVILPTAPRFPAVRALHPNYAPATILPFTSVSNLGLPSSEQFGLVWSGKAVTTLTAGITFAGRLLTEQGQPVAGATVLHSPDSFETLRTQTGPDGAFAFHGLAAGDFDMIATAPGMAQQYFKTNLTSGMGPVELRLDTGGLLRLRVEDEQGEPVQGATIVLTGPGGMYIPDFHWRVETGPDGRMEWTSAPADRLLNFVASKAPEFAMSSHNLFKADGQEHVIRLTRTFCVQGDVTDAKTGEPIRTEIRYFPGYGTDEHCWYRGETRRSTNGTFRISFGEADSYRRFRIEADGYLPFISEPLGDDAVAAFHVALQPAG